MRRSGVYAIRNEETGQCYIGSSIDIDERLWAHTCELRHGRHHSPHLQASWDHHGARAFTIKVLVLCSRRHLRLEEQRAIDFWKPAYNVLTTVPYRKNAGAGTSLNRAMNRATNWAVTYDEPFTVFRVARGYDVKPSLGAADRCDPEAMITIGPDGSPIWEEEALSSIPSAIGLGQGGPITRRRGWLQWYEQTLAWEREYQKVKAPRKEAVVSFRSLAWCPERDYYKGMGPPKKLLEWRRKQ